MGRGAHKTGTKALGIYLVEPKYFDGHKSKVTSGKQKRGKDGRRGWLKKAKSNQSTADIIESDTSDGDESDSEEEGGNQDVEDVVQSNAMDLTRPGQPDLPDNPDAPQTAFTSTC